MCGNPLTRVQRVEVGLENAVHPLAVGVARVAVQEELVRHLALRRYPRPETQTRKLLICRNKQMAGM